MRFVLSLLVTILLIDPAALSPLNDSRQLVLVTTASWESVDGILQRYERAAGDKPWRPYGKKIPIVVGRHGMAWGRGLHGAAIGDGPVKKEGDGKSPAGVFSLSSAFGYASKDQAGEVKLPYLHATKSLECVDDSKSSHYNQVLDRRTNPDWKSSEQMRRQDDQYRWGIIVDHNPQREAGCGSCIFLHIWAGPGKGTAGCSAMDAGRMEEVLFWLDPAKKPVLAQLPVDEYHRFRQSWKLP